MKRLLLLPVILLLISCASTEPMPESINTFGFDFSEYTEEGFLITPEQYLGEYQSIGLIRTVMWPRVYRVPSGSTDDQGNPNYDFRTEELNVEKAIDEIYQQAEDMGANAITRFDITSTSRRNGDMIVEGAEISGFAIKRTDVEN